MPLPRSRSFIGIAKETRVSGGTPPTGVAATDFIPVRSINVVDDVKYLDDQGWRGSMAEVYGVVPGNIHSQVELNGDVFPDTFGYFLGGVLGDYAQTSGAASTSTTLSSSAAAASATISTAASISAGTIIEIDSLGIQPEIRTVSSVTGTGPFTLTLNAVTTFAHNSGATVQTVNSTGIHTFALLNSAGNNSQPTSYSITDFDAYEARQFIGWQVSDVDIKFNADNLLEYTAKGLGYQSGVVGTPTANFGTLSPAPAWSGIVTIGNTSQANLVEGNCAITRTVTPIFTVDGSQTPYRLFAGPLKTEGSLTLVFEDDTNLNQYLQNSQPSLDVTFVVGTGSAQTSLSLHMTKAAFTTGKIERGKDYVEVVVGYRALANTTDVGASGGFSPIKPVLRNARASALYA